MTVIDSVRDRYAEGAQAVVPELCCPVDYDASLLKVLPQEIIDRDYGCGDPSKFVHKGDVVVDLGSGGGKICYMASQIAGPEGLVIGVDATDDMLALARDNRELIGNRIGWHNVEFKHGWIQDMALDRDKLGAWLEQNPITNLAGVEALETEKKRLRTEEPMIADASVDLVLSNCVLNLVGSGEKEQLFREISRVLKKGGRAAISDIVSDEDVPEAMQNDPDLWSGCISGAMREDRFLQAFADVGLYGVEIVAYQSQPWAVVQGVEFRSMTVIAYKGKEGACMEHNEAVIYKGPWSEVRDDDGHVLRRGQRTAVCRKTFDIYNSNPYSDSIISVAPLVEVSKADAETFDCKQGSTRSPQTTKFGVERKNALPSSCCEPESDCC